MVVLEKSKKAKYIKPRVKFYLFYSRRINYDMWDHCDFCDIWLWVLKWWKTPFYIVFDLGNKILTWEEEEERFSWVKCVCSKSFCMLLFNLHWVYLQYDCLAFNFHLQYRSFITSRRSYSWTIFTNLRERSDHSRTFVNVHNHSQSFVNVRERSWMIIHNHSWTFIIIPGTFMNVRLIFLYLKLIKSS